MILFLSLLFWGCAAHFIHSEETQGLSVTAIPVHQLDTSHFSIVDANPSRFSRHAINQVVCVSDACSGWQGKKIGTAVIFKLVNPGGSVQQAQQRLATAFHNTSAPVFLSLDTTKTILAVVTAEPEASVEIFGGFSTGQNWYKVQVDLLLNSREASVFGVHKDCPLLHEPVHFLDQPAAEQYAEFHRIFAESSETQAPPDHKVHMAVLQNSPPSTAEESIVAVMDKISLPNLQNHLTKLASIRNRFFFCPENIAAANNYIKSELSKLGLQVEDHQFLGANNIAATNIIATYLGADPNKYVVVGGHKDSITSEAISQVQRNNPQGACALSGPGAGDNAATVAAVLEIAKQVVTAKLKFKYSVKFVLFGCEEFGLYGSKAYNSKLKQDGVSKVVAVLNADIIAAAFTGSKFWIWPSKTTVPSESLYFRGVYDAYKTVGKLPELFFQNPPATFPGSSDQEAFYRDFPTTSLHTTDGDTHFPPGIHSASDTIAAACDLELMLDSTKLMLAYVGSRAEVAAPAICPSLTAPANGEISLTGTAVDGDTRSFRCNSGFALSGNALLTCADSKWSSEVPTCIVTGSCSDGIKNGKETGVDCGGDCPPCSTGPVDPSNPTYKWEIFDWGSCSKVCGGGFKARDHSCVDASTGQKVADNFCSSLHPVSTIAGCNQQPCSTYSWKYGPYSKDCNQECGSGLVERDVWCQVADGSKVLDEYCDPSRKPLSAQLCNTQPCTPGKNYWVASAWEPCDVQCGGGQSKRRVICSQDGKSGNQQLGGGITVLSDSECSGLKPVGFKACNTHACKQVQWQTCKWDDCTAVCEGQGTVETGGVAVGERTRAAVCIDSGKKVVDSAFCQAKSLAAPNLFENGCNPQACTRSYVWMTSLWGPCRNGYRQRTVHCHAKDHSNALDSMCEQYGGRMPVLKEQCGVFTYNACMTGIFPTSRKVNAGSVLHPVSVINALGLLIPLWYNM